MGTQKFNEIFLGNAKVPSTGMTASATPPAVGGRAVGRPSAVDQADGTANIRSDGQHRMAAPLSPNASGMVHRPAGVVSFTDHTV